MGLISRESIDAVIEANDIVDVVSAYVRLDKKSSLNLFGLCPFHDEKTPSFSVSPGKQIFYCFGCQKGGNVIRFIQEIEHLAYPEAIRHLAVRAGISIEESRDPFWQERFEKQNLAYEALKEAARHFYSNLEGRDGGEARAYLKQRGISRSLYRKYGLGYSLPRGNGLYSWLKGKGIREEPALDAGLIRERESSGYYDFFRGRLMFPIMDTQGRVLAFGRRAMTEGGPKYINSPETLVYQKGKHLFGIPQAAKSGTREWFLVEGYMDVLALSRAGLDNAVAPLGTALTDQQAKLISRYADSVSILMDGDQAGREASLRAGEILEGAGLHARYIFLGGVKDPDDYMKAYGAERLLEALGRTLDRTGYGLALLRHDRGLEKGMTEADYRDRALTLLAAEADSTKREIYGGALSRELSVSHRAVGEEIDRRRGLLLREQSPAASEPAIRNRRPAAAKRRAGDGRSEMMLLVMLADDPGLVGKAPSLSETILSGYSLNADVRAFLSSGEVSAVLSEEDFSSPFMKELARQAIGDAGEGKLTLASLHSIVDSILDGREEEEGDTSGSERVHSLIQTHYQSMAESQLGLEAQEKVYIQRLSELRMNRWRQRAGELNEKARDSELGGDDQTAAQDYMRAAVLTTAADAFRMIIQGEN